MSRSTRQAFRPQSIQPEIYYMFVWRILKNTLKRYLHALKQELVQELQPLLIGSTSSLCCQIEEVAGWTQSSNDPLGGVLLETLSHGLVELGLHLDPVVVLPRMRACQIR